MENEKVKVAIEKQRLFEYRIQCNVYKTADGVSRVVRNFIPIYMRNH